MQVRRYESPVGTLVLQAEGGRLCALQTADGPVTENEPDAPALRLAAGQLDEYFAGTRTAFTVPLHLDGTAFQRAVWQALLTIPYGQTRSYREVAAMVGNPRACRAVGMANHRNPVMILVPCHRVIGANGALVGYGGGLGTKEALLRLEQQKNL